LENLEKLTAVALDLGAYGLPLEAALIGSVFKTALEEVIVDPAFDPRTDFQIVESFRLSLYPLNPAAVVSSWLDATGLAWPSHRLPQGHRLEGALALLQWIHDRKREPEEIKRETARHYWDRRSRLSNERWSAVHPDIDAWWRHHLTQELPAALFMRR
jgi:hypothetical protein